MAKGTVPSSGSISSCWTRSGGGRPRRATARAWGWSWIPALSVPVSSDQLVMLGVLVEASEQLPGARRDDCGRAGRARKGLHRCPIVEGHDGEELDLGVVVVVATQEVHAA